MAPVGMEEFLIPSPPMVQGPGPGNGPTNPEAFGISQGFEFIDMPADHPAFDENIKRLRDIGARWVRWFTYLEHSWDENAADFNFSKLSAKVDKFRKNGLSVLLVLAGEHYYEKKEMAPYIDFVSRIVAHFKGKVAHYEILNEPNMQKQPISTYAMFVKEAHRVAKKADPQCKILANPVDMANRKRRRQIEDFLRALGKGTYFDIFSLHAYRVAVGPLQKSKEGLTLKEEIVEVKKILDKQGYTNTKIWITEISWPTRGANRDPEVGWVGTRPEEEQAQYLAEVYKLTKQLPYLEKVFWFGLTDTKDRNEDQFDYGLAKADGTPKKAYLMYKKLAKRE